jgi:hypothetical protein
MTKAIAQTYNVFNENVRVITYAFLIGSMLLAFVYSINLFAVISNTVAYQKSQAKMVELGSSVDELDTLYLSISGNINPDNLEEYGMTKGEVSEYITKAPLLKIGLNDQSNHVALRNER